MLETFRSTYPEHEMQLEATRQIAFAYREDGRLSRAAGEYERIASESEDPALRSEALLVAGDLYQKSEVHDRALDVFERYVEEFPQPLDTNLETRFKIAEIHEAAGDVSLYHQDLTEIVRIDAEAGPERSPRVPRWSSRSCCTRTSWPWSCCNRSRPACRRSSSAWMG